MTLEELKEELRRRQALIVHFSHHAAMRDNLDFPADLLQVLGGVTDWALSCSVLTPGHSMIPVGSVGVVLEPQTAGDVLRVHHSDAGAYSDGTDDYSDGEPLSVEGLDRSLTRVRQDDYNEWRVRGARPVGIFVLNPFSICVRRRVTFDGPFGPEETLAAQPATLADIRTIFADWPVWTMTPSGPVRI